MKKQLLRVLLVGYLFVFALSIQQSLVSNSNHWEVPPNDLLLNNNNINPVYNFLDLFSASNKEISKTNIELIPGGHSIGVTLKTKGVLVVGYADIINDQGKETSPARDSGIQIGDIILKINGNNALNDFQVAQEIDKKCKQNEKILLEIQHKGQVYQKTIYPVYCAETQRYRIGLFIRDEAAGVGTLTFIDSKTKTFGALGHVITDMDTNDKVELKEGRIVEASIYSIEKGKKGDPGEKIGTFMPKSSFSGTIEKNTKSGIFGICDQELINPYFKSAIPVGWKSEVQVGSAKIYTVINKNTIEEFDVQIEKVMQYRSDNKNMIVRITDPKLLEQTGGIIQGMSGSPIVQNGKIIGAVTHVFVNDATRGYGIFIENMLTDSGIKNQAASAQKGGFFWRLLKNKITVK